LSHFSRDPVVLVHGINANATSLIPVRDFFKNLNYGIGEVYATSYGPSSKNVDYSSTLECSYIKQIRQLIVAVNAYTIGKRVSVIAYSTGVPHARKAILGGDCVDTKENLGSPLTKQVNVFLSVAGANLGAAECTNFPSAAICGNTAGLKSTSAFFKDINSKSGYEGSSRFSIVSKTDDIVGFENSPLPGSQINVTVRSSKSKVI
jgi:triacylglycerol lipase